MASPGATRTIDTSTDRRASLPTDEPLALSRRLVEAARRGVIDADAERALATLGTSEVDHALADHDTRLAFWLNIYNAAVRARLLADPGAYRRRWRFFTSSAITVAGRRLSPNAIEHGLIRRSALVGTLGYLRNPFPSRYERQLRVTRLDPRVHFALNCGARSCPPLAGWAPGTLDADLERATGAYLGSETRRTGAGSEVVVPRLLQWYRGDFGGPRGTLSLLRRHGIIGAHESPRIRYGDYDWTLDLPDGSPGS